MRVASFIAAALAAVATASPMTKFRLMSTESEGAKSSIVWQVTNWSAGCARSGCHYDFNVSAPANTTARPQRPAFSAYCSGQGEDTPYSACELLGDPQTPLKVEAKLLLPTVTGNDSNPNIQVSFMHIDLQSQSTWWNYTGKAEAKYNQFSGPAMNFTITPSEIFGAA